MDAEFDHVRVAYDDSIATVTVDRPEVRNAMHVPTRRELRDAFGALEERDDVRVVVVRGSGDGNFVSGADIETLNEMTLAEGMEYADKHSQGLYNHIAEFPRPTIAAVDGYALGGGLELALACDVRVATPDAKFGLPEVTLGVIPGGGGTQRLQAVVGAGIARELVLTGKVIDADEAESIGLANHVFDPDRFDDEVRSLAEDVASNAPVAVRLAKEGMNRGLDLEAGLDFERMAFVTAIATEDKDEGTAAFLENRDAEFEGR
ncbi:MAG: enoyl-CoA hydratase/isomerase family protein [Haloferacaceae archaeon]